MQQSVWTKKDIYHLQKIKIRVKGRYKHCFMVSSTVLFTELVRNIYNLKREHQQTRTSYQFKRLLGYKAIFKVFHRPVFVNPATGLLKIALEVNWQIERFNYFEWLTRYCVQLEFKFVPVFRTSYSEPIKSRILWYAIGL